MVLDPKSEVLTIRGVERMLLRPWEAAETLGISRSGVYKLIASGELGPVRVGRSLRIPAEEVRRYARALAAAQNQEGV